ncbi:unnamed protein product [Phytophthora fragariaefolia]|uniref:Unnamed protein product n=1 Tax=Phytophthora fragariaefolia TaxID=1490495 RepID=A0A9W6YLG7_9STRA|nr:unnamed protein product [Phytophthora fragariaefolia]
MPTGGILQLDPPVVHPQQARWYTPTSGREAVKLDRSPVWNPVRAERSKFFIYAYVEKQSKSDVRKLIRPIDNTRGIHDERTMSISTLHQVDEFGRSEMTMTLNLLHGESRGYWKSHVPDKKFRQAKATGEINNENATLPFDSGAEVSILDTAFARKVGCYINDSQKLECEGVGNNPYMASGRTSVKLTLAGSLVYYFDVWVGPPAGGQDLILGMDFMVPAGVRLDLADGSLSLPDEIRIHLAGRRPLYGEKVPQVKLDDHCNLGAGGTFEVRKGFILSAHRKLWVTRVERLVPSVVAGLGKTRYLKITNISDQKLALQADTRIGMWLEGGRVPRTPGFVLVGSRRYAEWQNLAFQSTTDQESEEEIHAEPDGPRVDRPLYETPLKILRRDAEDPKPIVAHVSVVHPDEAKPEPRSEPVGRAGGSDRPIATDSVYEASEAAREIRPDHEETASQLNTPPTATQDDTGDEEVCYHEGGDMFSEDAEKEMAVLPEVTGTMDEVTIEDIQVGDPAENTPEEIERLRQIIWKRRHLLMGKGNALPPAAVGAICDIDVEGAAPVAQRVRRVAPQFREKLSDLIKSLLSAKMITPSASPWASPIVIIIKKNGVDIRLCIDYRLVNSLTRLTVYPMPMINGLLEDLDKVLWYCSLDMVSDFLVVSMTERARKISAFITPFGPFEWTRMPFGLQNARQIYQRLIDNAMYGYLRISADQDRSKPVDVFEVGEPEPNPKPSVLGRRSYIDDILVTATTWDSMLEKVERLLDACERWNLSISVVKSFWGQRKVGYLGHQVSAEGLEANPKDLETLGNLPFPLTLRAMQSFLGSLNYYRRFIVDFAIYAVVLYELREGNFHEIRRQEESNSSGRGTGGVVTSPEQTDR